MDKEKQREFIDWVLNRILNKTEPFFATHSLYDEAILNYADTYRTMQKIHEDGFIIYLNNSSDHLKLTDLGEEVARIGYIAYKERLNSQTNKVDIVKKLADDFVLNYIEDQYPNHEQIVELVRSKVLDFHNVLDKIKYLNIILLGNNKEYEKHLMTCITVNCSNNEGHELITYYLGGDLQKLGGAINNDLFTTSDKLIAEERLNKIIEELIVLKDGQQIIYDELNELKDLYFLGKKKWYKQYLGTISNMVLGGVISEATAKPLLNLVENAATNFIDK